MKKTLFSGCAPSGTLTIGNYIGALRHWKDLQHRYDSYFCIVDLHAITLPRDPAELREKRLDFLALYLACGIDPSASTIFIQSDNPDHAELAWILGCTASHGELSRMTQFKDKAAKNDHVSGGLYFYPVLMAADILLYRTDMVPIGADQQQHLELARNIAGRFNSLYGDVFTIPEGFSPKSGNRIRNLLDPTRKMDKSSENPKTYIALTDTDDQIRSKIMKAKTDSTGDYPLMDDNEGITNLAVIMSALAGMELHDIREKYLKSGYGEFKRDVADLIIGTVKPVRSEFMRLRSEISELEKIIDAGKTKAGEKSEKLLSKVKQAVGLE